MPRLLESVNQSIPQIVIIDAGLRNKKQEHSPSICWECLPIRDRLIVCQLGPELDLNKSRHVVFRGQQRHIRIGAGRLKKELRVRLLNWQRPTIVSQDVCHRGSGRDRPVEDEA